MAAQIFGLDIGTTLIKAVQFQGDATNLQLVAAGMTPTPARGLTSDAETDLQQVALSVRSLVREARVTTPLVVASLPESQIFTRVIELPVLTDTELQSAIKYEAEQYIPIPLSEVKLDYEVLSRPAAGQTNQKMEVLLVAAPTILVTRYLKLLDMVGLKPYALDTEITSTARALLGRETTPAVTLIIEIGAATTELSIVSGRKISLTRSLAVGGASFTRAVAQGLGFELAQAEQYKITYGLDSTDLEGKVGAAIKPIFDVIVNEAKRAVVYWAGKYPQSSIKRFILTGGSSKMAGSLEYLVQATGLEGLHGELWNGVTFGQHVPAQVRADSAFYATAAGLALKDIYGDE